MAYPNPLFDTSFKITMQDPDVANDVLSALLSKKVSLLYQSPQEHQLQAQRIGNFHRLDYLCVIDDGGVPKKVMIELQRMKDFADYERFRRYLGFQMMTNSDIAWEYEGWRYYSQQLGLDDSKEAYKKHVDTLKNNGVLEIITVYLLNFEVGIDSAMFESPDFFIDISSQKPTTKKRQDSDFCRLLQHKMYVVQFPLMEEMLQNIGENEALKHLKNLMEFWITGAKTDKYLIDEKGRHFEGLGQKVYEKLHDSYENDEKTRFSILDEARTEQELKKGLQLQARYMAQEMAKDMAKEMAENLAEEMVKKAEEERTKAEEERTKAEEKRTKAEEEAKRSKVAMIKMMFEFGKTIEEIITQSKLSESEILALKNS